MVLDPENASGMSATILSIADKNGSCEGSSCAGRWIFSATRSLRQSFAKLVDGVRQVLAPGFVGRVDMRREITGPRRLRALFERPLEIGGYVHQLSEQSNRRAQLRLEMQAVLRAEDQPSQP